MIHLTQGNLLDADVEALVNAVNCVGVMGKGIALQFKQQFPANFVAYKRACLKHQVQIGQMFVVPTEQLGNPQFIINFPTKLHWRDKSRIEDIVVGLQSLRGEVETLNIKSIAIPALGCGNGGLEWSEVKPLIEETFNPLPEIYVALFKPEVL